MCDSSLKMFWLHSTQFVFSRCFVSLSLSAGQCTGAGDDGYMLMVMVVVLVVELVVTMIKTFLHGRDD